MKFRTKLIITFLTVILLPLLLSAIAFLAIGAVLIHNSDLSYGFETTDYSTMSDSLASFSDITDDIFCDIEQLAETDPSRLEDKEYLAAMNEDAFKRSSYILVRKGTGIYYSGNETATQKIFGRLPSYGFESRDTNAGYYYNDMQKLVKQIDFRFSDGSEGSVFIITRVNSVKIGRAHV